MNQRNGIDCSYGGGAILIVGIFLMAAFVPSPNVDANANNGPASSPSLAVAETGPLTGVSCTIKCCHYEYQNVKEVYEVYYNSASDLLIYVLQTCINAINGANIAGCKWAGSHTIYNVIENEGYCGEYCISPGHYQLERRIGTGPEYICVWVPPVKGTKFDSYGDFINPTPNGYYEHGSQGSVSLSTTFSACGISAGISTTYNIPIYTVDVGNNSQSCFSSFQIYCKGGQTYDQFVSMIETKYHPDARQEVHLSSTNSVTYITGKTWYGANIINKSTNTSSINFITSCIP